MPSRDPHLAVVLDRYAGNGVGRVTLADVEAVFTRWYSLRDLEPIHVTLGAVMANQLDSDPLWLFLVAPPGSLKTEIIRALNGVTTVYPLSNLTAQTFASGYQTKGEEPSLLLKLDGKILTLKDFTTVLTMHRDKRGEILAQLREIYDGHYRKEFGNAKVVDWTGKLGLLAGVTPIIDTYHSVAQVLGERFILYRLAAPDERAVARRSMRQQGHETEMRREARDSVAAFLATRAPGTLPAIPEPVEDRLAALAVFTARARSGVIWDARGNDIEYVPEPEGPGRLAKQLATLARGVAIVRDHPTVDSADYATVARVARDTVPAARAVMLDQLVPRHGTWTPTPEIATATGYPTSTTRRYLLELHAMKLADREPGSPGLPDRWQLSAQAATLVADAAPTPAGDGESLLAVQKCPSESGK
jgi:hypothetical protein